MYFGHQNHEWVKKKKLYKFIRKVCRELLKHIDRYIMFVKRSSQTAVSRKLGDCQIELFSNSLASHVPFAKPLLWVTTTDRTYLSIFIFNKLKYRPKFFQQQCDCIWNNNHAYSLLDLQYRFFHYTVYLQYILKALF